MEVQFRDILNIYEFEVRKNTKNKKKIYRFERFKMQYLNEIYNTLLNGTYKYMKYTVFMVYVPKYRIVMSLNKKIK